MSSIAEFYSRNLANEVIKGTQQKVQAGGTPTRAPIGYRNVRQIVNGYEVRTVETDSQRAPLITWAFEQYATGEYSLSALAAELEQQGLTFRAGPKTPERPVPANKLHASLTNRYYLGLVTWRGVEHDGKHPPLVSSRLFEQVQEVMSDHRVSGERNYRRDHYLSTRGVGSAGEYFYCASRPHRHPCGQRYLPAHLIEGGRRGSVGAPNPHQPSSCVNSTTTWGSRSQPTQSRSRVRTGAAEAPVGVHPPRAGEVG